VAAGPGDEERGALLSPLDYPLGRKINSYGVFRTFKASARLPDNSKAVKSFLKRRDQWPEVRGTRDLETNYVASAAPGTVCFFPETSYGHDPSRQP
jgi:hypothetical protein